MNGGGGAHGGVVAIVGINYGVGAGCGPLAHAGSPYFGAPL